MYGYNGGEACEYPKADMGLRCTLSFNKLDGRLAHLDCNSEWGLGWCLRSWGINSNGPMAYLTTMRRGDDCDAFYSAMAALKHLNDDVAHLRAGSSSLVIALGRGVYRKAPFRGMVPSS